MDIDQSTLVWIFRTVFLLLSLLVAGATWGYMRRVRYVNLPARKEYTPPSHIELPNKTVMLSIMARPGRFFDTLKLFKIMHQLGFHFSENQIFEYILDDEKTIAFSIINIRNPGTFNQNPHAMKQTNGLAAVMQLPVLDGNNQLEYFHLLLSVLEELRIGLDAMLCDAKRNPLRNDKLYHLQKEIEIFEQNYCTLIQNDFSH